MSDANQPAKPANLAIALRVLCRLLAYPDAALRADLPDVRAALRADGALGAERKRQLYALIDTLEDGEVLDHESAFVDLFDRGRATSLHLFEHVHGDSRQRGPAMIDLLQTYAQAGLALNSGELPDYLPVVLEFASTQTPRIALELLGETAHLVGTIHDALCRRPSPHATAYAAVLGALLDLSGAKSVEESAEPAEAPTDDPAGEESLDASWEEPAVFSGCSSAGQGTPGVHPLRRMDAPRDIHANASASNGVSP